MMMVRTSVALALLVAGLPGDATAEDQAGQSAWSRTLPGGPTVELLGISTHPSGPETWWRPDGSRLERPPYTRLHNHFPAEGRLQVREFALRVSGRGGPEGISIAWDVQPHQGLGSSTPERGDSSRPGRIFGAAATLPEGRATATVRVGVAAGPWTTEATHKGRGLTGVSTPTMRVVFSRARATAEGTALVVAHTLKGPEIRVVAVDREGRSHAPGGAAATSGEGLAMHDLEFRLPPDEIAEFRVQTRPYEWAEFEGVPLRPDDEAKP